MRTLTTGELPAQPVRIVVVGGGAAGVITASHLLRHADARTAMDVLIVEKDDPIGPGLAYRTAHPLHTLNNYAARLSAVPGDPDHLLRWCAERGVPAGPTSFLPRELYGRYLCQVLDDADVPGGSMLRRARATVRDVRDAGAELTVELAPDWAVPADVVVLALGNPPPRPLAEPARAAARVLVDDPWAGDPSASLAGAGHVLLVGTGLTMVDVVAQLHAASPETRFTAVSRSGRLPTAHHRGSQRLHDVFDPGRSSLDELVARMDERGRELSEIGGDWRDAVDSVRVHANRLWAGFSTDEQDLFVARLARRWETLRHRMSPDMAAHIADLRSAGVLRVARLDEVDLRGFDGVVNCTGPAPTPTRGWNPLVDTLLQRGTIRPHRLGLGLDLDPHGRVLDADGRPDPRLYVVGAARRGIEWEVGAIPDLRTQAAVLAEHVLAEHSVENSGGAAPRRTSGATA